MNFTTNENGWLKIVVNKTGSITLTQGEIGIGNMNLDSSPESRKSHEEIADRIRGLAAAGGRLV